MSWSFPHLLLVLKQPVCALDWLTSFFEAAGSVVSHIQYLLFILNTVIVEVRAMHYLILIAILASKDQKTIRSKKKNRLLYHILLLFSDYILCSKHHSHFCPSLKSQTHSQPILPAWQVVCVVLRSSEQVSGFHDPKFLILTSQYWLADIKPIATMRQAVSSLTCVWTQPPTTFLCEGGWCKFKQKMMM